MFEHGVVDGRWSCRFSARADQVERAVTLLREHLQAAGLALDEDGEVVARELLNNAVEHGCRKDPAQVVTATCAVGADRRWTLTVEDPGPGFDHQRLTLDLPAQGGGERHYGLPWVKVLADELRFEQGGRRVVAVVAPGRSAGRAGGVRIEAGVAVAVLPAQVTAAAAEGLRAVLAQALDAQATAFRLDCGAVTAIDSVGLSVLLVFFRQAKAEKGGRTVTLSGVRGAMLRLMRMSHVEAGFGVRIQEGA